MVPEGWGEHRFGDVVRLANGQVDPRSEPYASMPHIGPENIQSGTGKLSEVKTAAECGVISGKYEFDEYALVYSKIRPNLNKVAIPAYCGICSADMYPIWGADGVTHTEYLLHFMLSIPFVEAATAVSLRTGMPKINRPDLSAIKIALPPLPEQRKIADILSTWDRAIETTEALLATARTQKRALMQSLLTGKRRFPEFEGQNWKEVRLGDVLDINYGKSPRDIFDDEGKYPVLGTGGVTGRTNAVMADGPVIVIGRKGTIDSPQWVDGKFWCIDTTYYCTTNDENDLRWLFAWLGSINLRIYNEASGVPSLSRETLRSIKVTLPNKAEQQRIADVFIGAAHDITSLTTQVEKLRTEKKALMQQLLTGKRRVVV